MKNFWNKWKLWIWYSVASVLVLSAAVLAFNSKKPETFRDRVEQHLRANGAHKMLEGYVKSHMNDPESFEHVSTEYIMPKDTGVTATVYVMTFRGKNKFGGVVTQTIRASCDIKTGKVLNVNTRPY